MPYSAQSSQHGFTMLELLVVITILVLTTAATIPSFAGYIRNQGLKQAIENVRSDIRNVQNKALTGTSSDMLIGGVPIRYWAVKFSPNSTTYEYFVATSTASCPASIPVAQTKGATSLAETISVKTASSFCLFFDMANGDIISVPSASQVIVGYTSSSASGDCRRLMFNPNGLIYSSPSVLCT